MSRRRRNYFRAEDSEHHWLLFQQMKWFLFPSLSRPRANRPLFVVNAKTFVVVLLYWIKRKETKEQIVPCLVCLTSSFLECMKYYYFSYQAKLSCEKSLCKLPSKSLFNLSQLQHFSIITKLDLLDGILEGSQLSSTFPGENTVHGENA